MCVQGENSDTRCVNKYSTVWNAIKPRLSREGDNLPEERGLQLQATLLLATTTLTAVAVLQVALASPVTSLVLQLRIDPAVVHGSLRVSLGQTKGLHGLVLAVTLTALDADALGLQILIVLKEQPAILIPEGDALVHAVVPGLKTLDGTLGSTAKHGSKVLLDALPFQLLVMPSVDNEVSFLGSILLVDVSVLAIRRRAGVAVQAHMRSMSV